MYSFEHEIRRRTTDRREVITRITRIFFCTRIALCILLNTNYADNTNIFIWHTDLTDLMDLCSRRGAHMGNTRFLNTDVTLYFFEHEIRRRTTDRREVITRITRILFAHGSHGSLFAAVRSQFFEHEFLGGTRNSLTLLFSFYLLQESFGDVAGGDGT